MEKLNFKNYYELAEEIFNSALCDDVDMALIADYEIVYNVFKGLFTFDDGLELEVADIELGNGVADGYEGPYLLSLGGDGEIWIQKAMASDNKILCTGAEVLYVQPKYTADVLKRNDVDIIFEIYFGEEEKEPKFHLITDQDDKPCGFEYNDEGDGYCYHMRYCSCESKDIKDIVDMYNGMAEVFSKWINK